MAVLCALMIVLWLPQSWLLPPKCLNETVLNKRTFEFNNRLTNITIGTSDTVTHTVTSHILRIILTEILGYSDVEIVPGGETDELLNLGAYNHDYNIEPKVMINLEVWKDVDWTLDMREIEVLGNISPLGRFSWFVRNYENFTWLMFKDLNFSRRFSLWDKADMLDNLCMLHNCSDYFVPDYCSGRACAILLVDAQHYDWTDALKENIETLNLYVRVKKVFSLAKMLLSLPGDSDVVVLALYPTEVTATGDWRPVAFPGCSYSDERSTNCLYDSMRLLKLVSAYLKNGAPLVYDVVHDLKLNRMDQLDILKKALDPNTNFSAFDLACQYLKKNNRYLQLRNKHSSKTPLKICGIFPLDDVHQSKFSAPGLPSAAKMAADHINNNDAILPNHELIISEQKVQCNSEQVMNTFIDYIWGYEWKEMVGILGPACSESLEALVSLTTHFRTSVISYGAEGSIYSISNRTKYPYFFRTIGENLAFQQVYLKLLQEMKWKRLGSLTEDAGKYSEYLTYMKNLLFQNGIVFEHSIFVQSHLNGSIKDLRSRRTRIIVADVHDAAARAVMCEAYKQNMTSKHGYVWFLPHWLSRDWYDTDHTSNYSQKIHCSTKEMKQAIEGYFTLSYRHFAPNETWLPHSKMTVKDWKQKYMKQIKKLNIEPSIFSGYVYDAVWTYALALDKLDMNQPEALTNIHTVNATRKYVEYLQATNFTGVTGKIEFLNGGPSRTSLIDVLQWYGNKFHTIGTYNDSAMDNQLYLNLSTLRWFTANGQQPEDEVDEACSLQWLKEKLGTTCMGAMITVNVLGFFFAVSIITAAVVFYKRKYDKRIGQLKETEKYMRQFGFDLIPPSSADIDKWEIPRNSVVINRKLGEGAFGTVYGGEVNTGEDGWVAAAVKTLKPTCKDDEKMDFVGEAELLKRFDHKNIVKLLGVCTRNEPMFTIMEFMLYGDLKSFLQNRRHLVTSRHTSDESNEVSSKRLTSYALDISRGLSYLSAQKFVHRDIACRNCLLNSAKVAKIGDFGLTRRIYESDYYRFSRKGMLPIRWMAPESLADGLFTSKSDVWAFGVVIFEIVTFGSYPYPGLSNNEVMDHVKSGNTIGIPKGAKFQLFSLLLLEPGEIYFEDFNSELHIVSEKTTAQGRLKLCSKSLIFEPNDIKIPMYKILLRNCNTIEEKNMQIHIVSQHYSTMLAEFRIAPYKFHHKKEIFLFSLNYVPIDSCLEQILQLQRACSLPPHEESAMVAAITYSRQRRQKFDLNWLEDIHEQIEVQVEASKISALMTNPGRIVLTTRRIYFQPFNNAEHHPVLKIDLIKITHVKKRRFLQVQVGLEIFCVNSNVSQLYLSFNTEECRNSFYDQLLQQSFVQLSMISSEIMTLKWQNHAISNYEYLQYLNSMADRSISDLTQYPVFPWVISDYTSPTLDLENASIYRDLSKPIGALNVERLNRLRGRQQQMPEPGYLYGSHYSTPAFVLFYLVRKYPLLMLCLQNGRFDHPDRIFHNVADVWRNVLNNMSDFKELIPEFYDPENGGDFLENNLGLDLGIRHDGRSVHDVELPPWCDSAHNFIKIFREALESNYVSQHLHLWIDLIFGCKQRGQMALENNNVFHPVCYEGSVNLDEISDINERHALEVQIMEFGQIPKNIFQVPHPPRLKLTPTVNPFIDISTLDNRTGLIITEHRDAITSLSCRDNTILSISKDSVIKKYNCNLNQEEASFSIGAIGLSAVILLPDGTTAVLGTYDNRILMFDLDCGKVMDEVRAHEDAVSELQWCDAAQLLLSASRDGSMLLWRGVRTRLITSLATRFDHDTNITAACLNRSGSLAACGTEDGELFVYDIESASTVFYSPKSEVSITGTMIASDDRKIICSSRMGYKIHDFLNGLLVCSACPELHITAISWFTEKILILGDNNGFIHCIDYEKVEPHCKMNTNFNLPVVSVAEVLSAKSIVCAFDNKVMLFTCP